MGRGVECKARERQGTTVVVVVAAAAVDWCSETGALVTMIADDVTLNGNGVSGCYLTRDTTRLVINENIDIVRGSRVTRGHYDVIVTGVIIGDINYMTGIDDTIGCCIRVVTVVIIIIIIGTGGVNITSSVIVVIMVLLESSERH